MSTSGAEQSPSESKKSNAAKMEVKARLRNLGEGALEFDGGVVRFYVEKGRFRKSRELVKEIRVVDVEGLGREGNELSVSSNGVTSYFVVDKAESVDGLFTNLSSLVEQRKMVPENVAEAPSAEHEEVAGLTQDSLVEAVPTEAPSAESKQREPAQSVVIGEAGAELETGETQGTQKPKKINASRLPTKASYKDYGTGVLEFKDNFVRFYAVKGRLKKQRELKKEISIDTIDSISHDENSLNIMVQSNSEAFVLQKGASVDLLVDQIEGALKEKEELLETKKDTKQRQEKLFKTANGVNDIADDLFDILIGMHGRIDWENIKIHAKHAQDSFDSLTHEELISPDLKIGKNILAGKGHETEKVFKVVFADLKNMYDFIGTLASGNSFSGAMHPNCEDVQSAVRAYYTLNDIVLGTIVGDQELNPEIDALFTMLDDLSKQMGLSAEVEPLREAIRKLQSQRPTEEAILEIRSVLRNQLKQLLNS